jgi:hypothetical protein
MWSHDGKDGAKRRRSFGTPARELIERHLAGSDPTPCVALEGDDPLYAFAGTGVPIAQHPTRRRWPEDSRCQGCGSTNVLVIAAEETTNPVNGDNFFNGQIRCSDCRDYSTYSFET